jgi:hypothetical protein
MGSFEDNMCTVEIVWAVFHVRDRIIPVIQNCSTPRAWKPKYIDEHDMSSLAILNLYRATYSESALNQNPKYNSSCARSCL